MRSNMLTWESFKHFKKTEKWGDPDKMDLNFVKLLDDFRHHIDHPITILEGYALYGHVSQSQHHIGKAADLRIHNKETKKPLSAAEHLLLSTRSPFNGIGIYTWSANGPFVHWDNRDLIDGERKIWVSTKPGIYSPITKEFLEIVLSVS